MDKVNICHSFLFFSLHNIYVAWCLLKKKKESLVSTWVLEWFNVPGESAIPCYIFMEVSWLNLVLFSARMLITGLKYNEQWEKINPHGRKEYKKKRKSYRAVSLELDSKEQDSLVVPSCVDTGGAGAIFRLEIKLAQNWPSHPHSQKASSSHTCV